MREIRLLFLAANPEDAAQLRLHEEARDIQEKLRGARFRDFISLRTRWAVRANDLMQALNEDRPHIVHFSGHGTGPGGIMLLNEGRGARKISSESLRQLFSVLRHNVRVVVLNACYTDEQAGAIAEVVDAVVGMSEAIRDDSARIFSSSFYRALGFGASVANAFEQGQLAISLEIEDRQQAQVPVLITRPEVDATKIMLIGEEPSFLRLAKDGAEKASQTASPWERVGDVDEVPSPHRIDVVNPQMGRAFLESGLEELLRNRRHWERFCIILLDIDKLTVINKYFDRSIGNEVVVAMGRIVAKYHHRGNLVGRCGDDTFYVVHPKGKLQQALEIAETIRADVNEADWSEIAEGLQVTCSIGVAERHGQEHPRSTAIRAAMGFNRVKTRGGNGVVIVPISSKRNVSDRLEDHFS